MPLKVARGRIPRILKVPLILGVIPDYYITNRERRKVSLDGSGVVCSSEWQPRKNRENGEVEKGGGRERGSDGSLVIIAF